MSSLPEPASSAEPAAERDTDADLVAACQRGEARAWERLVGRFERLIYTIPRRAGLGDDEAGDVFQIVFERLHRHIDRLAQPERVQAWLVTTAKRETLRLLREGRRTRPFSALDGAQDDAADSFESGLEDPAALPEQVLEQLQLQHLARSALARLGEPCRGLLDLLYGQDEPASYADISRRLGMPAGSIGPTRARCLDKLRLQMKAIG